MKVKPVLCVSITNNKVLLYILLCNKLFVDIRFIEFRIVSPVKEHGTVVNEKKKVNYDYCDKFVFGETNRPYALLGQTCRKCCALQ